MSRYVCVHGHFYQPPREDPWLEAIDPQPSAAPYHDWNERVTAECYGPNTASRILDGEGRIERILNNYSRISFNFGPTLLAWLERREPEVYAAVLAADREGSERFGGHGGAIAQSYNHVILPLANRRDKRTQIVWGLRDFAHRFGRPAAGLWLPETAVDLESLEIAAELGVRFVLLEPGQAKRVRRVGEEEWHDARGAVDCRTAYRAGLPAGREIAVFFYDGGIARAVAFDGLLESGESFAARLLGAFSGADRPQLVHIATDGETYGHHHRYGEMALSYALSRIEADDSARLTNYGEFLASHPPEHEVEIVESSSWSCVHGVERWRSDCGCHTGGEPGWNQAWRRPLREAMDWLRDELAGRYETAAGELFADPWAARDDYVEVVLDRSPANVDAFFARWSGRELAAGERVRALKLVELQRHAMLMYTSCGWFFNDLAGLETVQVLAYAGRAAQLAEDLFGGAIEEPFLALLERAKSNSPEAGDGRRIFERRVRPAVVDLRQVAAHYAVNSLFEVYPDRARIYCYSVEREDARSFRAGRATLAAGRVRVASELTAESALLRFAVLHFGDHNFNAGVREVAVEANDTEGGTAGSEEGENYERLLLEAVRAFERADFPAVIRLLDRHFGEVPYSLKSLFRDEQQRVLDTILGATLNEVESELHRIHQRHAPLMRFLADLESPLPPVLRALGGMVSAADLRRALGGPAADPAEARRLLGEAEDLGIELDAADLSYVLEQTLQRLMERLRGNPEDAEVMERLTGFATLAGASPLKADLWRSQNLCYEMLQTVVPQWRSQAAAGDPAAAERLDLFRMLGRRLRLKVE